MTNKNYSKKVSVLFLAYFLFAVTFETVKALDTKSITIQSDTPSVIELPYEPISWDKSIDSENKELDSSKADEDVISVINDVFGSEATDAIKIFTCESRLNPDTVGDKNLTFVRNGQTYGMSVGIAQIRVLPGRTNNPKEYQQQLRDIRFNLQEAKKIKDQAKSWRPWYYCAKKNDLL